MADVAEQLPRQYVICNECVVDRSQKVHATRAMASKEEEANSGSSGWASYWGRRYLGICHPTCQLKSLPDVHERLIRLPMLLSHGRRTPWVLQINVGELKPCTTWDMFSSVIDWAL
jgi:hypothetical protein